MLKPPSETVRGWTEAENALRRGRVLVSFGGRGAIIDESPSQIRRSRFGRRTGVAVPRRPVRNRVNSEASKSLDFVNICPVAQVLAWSGGLDGEHRDEIIQGEPAGTNG
jgi:hypothetical protein